MGKKIGEWQIDKRNGKRFRWVYNSQGWLVKEYEPGPWETDSQGKRFRMVGDIKEYERLIHTTMGTFTESEFKSMRRGEKHESEGY